MIQRHLIAVLALLGSIFLNVPAHAGTFKGYFYGAKSPSEIASLVEQSLGRKADGSALLSDENCNTRGGCATPLDYMASFRVHDPEGAPKTLAELPAYLRKLVIKHGVEGKYQMDRIYHVGAAHRADVSGMSRTFLKDEAAWVNPETGRPVLAENCANPVGQRIDISCVYVDFETRDSTEYAVAWARYDHPTDQCFAYRKVSHSEQLDSLTAQWHNVAPGCLGRPCNFRDVNAVVGREPKAVGLIRLSGPGYYQIRMSPNEFLVLCLKLSTGIQQGGNVIFGSFASGIRWKQDYRLVSSEQHARVRYSTDDVRAAGLTLDGPRGLAFWAGNERDQAAMRGMAFSR